MLISLLSLALLLAVSLAALGLRSQVVGRERWLLAGLTLLSAGVWLRGDGRLEGTVLWTVTPAHGLTVGDLLVLLPAAAVALLGRDEVSRRRVR